MTGSGVFSGRRFAVVGLGRNGLPAARRLVALGAEVLAWDDSAPARAAATDLAVGVPDFAAARFDALVLSPGIAHRLPAAHPLAAAAIAAGVPIWSDAELLFAAHAGRARFAGITGTNGKSTTTALLAHLLSVAGIANAAGGNLGRAALDLSVPGGGVFVLEMSSYMLERLASLRFDVAAMLNLSPDHLDRHGDMAGYIAAKRAIFDRQRAGDLAVVGIDDPHSAAMARALDAGPARVMRISGFQPADLWCDHGRLCDREGMIVDLADCRALPGAHNAQNAAAACALAMALGAPRAGLAAGLAGFAGLPHRQRRVGQIDGVTFIDDSKATNADAAARALGCYEQVIWIAGGQAKAGGITALAPWFSRIARALLIGADAPMLAASLAQAGVPHEIVGTLEAAVPAAFAAARERSVPVVLLSPACASFDQFAGFEARGRRFAELVGGLDVPAGQG